MNRSLTWVLGGGGLLGRHVLKAIAGSEKGPVLWRSGPSGVPWDNPKDAVQALKEQAETFAACAESMGHGWTVIWCAGSGTVGSDPQALAQETSYLECILTTLGRKLPSGPGQVLLASSAGGVYGRSPDHPITEASPCMPISHYGRNKLAQEELVRAWAQDRLGVSTLVARISNLYGPGQRLDKPQGLITHLSRSIFQRVAIRIFVPLDTLRDYLFVEDCARGLLAGLARLGQEGREDIVKIFHSGETTTIAGLLGIYSRLTKGHARMICSSTPVTIQQPARLQYRSIVWGDLKVERQTNLYEGVQRVHAHLFALFQQGLLPPRS